MFFYNVVVYCVLIMFAKVVISNEGKKKSSKVNDGDVKHTFAKLLKTLVKVNEERLQAMEKITRLQDYMLTKNKLKIDDDSYDSMEEEDNRLLFDFANMPLLRRTEDETIIRAMCNRFNLESNNVHIRKSQLLKLVCRSYSIELYARALARNQ